MAAEESDDAEFLNSNYLQARRIDIPNKRTRKKTIC